MSNPMSSMHGEWSTRWAFILAATGSAVGLGNIWKFPYITGENGGGAFVIVYLLCIAFIGVPVMMAEILLGRRGRQSPINAMRSLAEEARRHRAWALLGWSGVVAGFLILSYYSVIAGWALAYVPRAAAGMFNAADAGQAAQLFNALTGDPERLIAWHTLFMVMTALVIGRGVQKGLERAARILMPSLFVLLLVLVAYAATTTGKFMEAVHFLFNVDFHKLFYPGCLAQTACDPIEDFSGNAVLVAMGHSFFTLSLGMGAIMVYGAYLPKEASITSTTVAIAIADTLVALLAGLVIFPLVFANGLAPDAGPKLIFITMPIAFGQMPLGDVFGTLFFLLLVFAAWTSAISLLEPAVAWLVENRNLSRASAVSWCAVVIWLLGLLTVFSFNLLADFKPLFGMVLFDLIDYLTSNIMLPLGGFFIAVFAAWMMHRDARHDELGSDGTDISYRTWLLLIRYVTPVGVMLVFLSAIGVFK